MLRSCKYCGRIHPEGYECPKKPKYNPERTSEADRFRKTYRWQQKREQILERDYHLCRVCFDRRYGQYWDSAPLQVHHIEPLEERFDLRLDENNLISCCSFHHKMAEKGEIPREYLRRLAVSPPEWGAVLGR